MKISYLSSPWMSKPSHSISEVEPGHSTEETPFSHFGSNLIVKALHKAD